MAIMQYAADDDIGFTNYRFSADEDTDDGVSYYLDCVAAYPEGLTAAQVARRVTASYHYDGSSFATEAEREDYKNELLRSKIADEYADAHDGEYPTEEYLNEQMAEQYGMATPESAAR